ncbi:MAG: NADH-quinone oxidoreductase subunit C, partial [Burkholderiales bacterium]|nr:NADH-quinone oxidoreductase subunit C [Burkholderiales bacterium]
MSKLETLKSNLQNVLGGAIQNLTESMGQLTLIVKAADYREVALKLRDDPSLKFEQLIDLCGMDYSAFGGGAWSGPRFATVVQLLSITHN